jgi:hypothetical protein
MDIQSLKSWLGNWVWDLNRGRMVKRGDLKHQRPATKIVAGLCLNVVPRAGVEPARPRTRDFKSLASTNFAIGAVALKSREYIGLHSMKQARKILK